LEGWSAKSEWKEPHREKRGGVNRKVSVDTTTLGTLKQKKNKWVEGLKRSLDRVA